MNWWQWYILAGLIVLILVVTWDRFTSYRQPQSLDPLDLLKTIGILTLAACAIAAVWPIALVLQLKDIAAHVANPPKRFKTFKVSRKHLVKQLSVQDAEILEIVEDPLGCVPSVPFGFLNHAWTQFLTDLSPIDTLWAFTACEVCGFQLEEREGYAIVRCGWIRRTMLTSRMKIGVQK